MLFWLTLLVWCAPLTSMARPAFVPDPDHEAEEIRQAREREIRERDLDHQKPRPCRYISDISTPPPNMRVALTFDDGPDPVGTPYILEVLAKYKIRAAFFNIGSSAEANRPLVERVLDAGHLIVGNHSWTHPSFHEISVAEQKREVRQTYDLLGQYQEQRFFRYPYGNSTCEANDFVHGLGYKIVGWHVDSCDWAFNKTGSVGDRDARICEVHSGFKHDFLGHVADRLRARKGGILLMHEIQPNTIRQLDTLIERLLHEGFTFGSIDEPGFAPSLR